MVLRANGIGLLVIALVLASQAEGHQIYLNQWAVEVEGGEVEAQRIAAEHGFYNLGQVGQLKDIFLFEQHAIHKRSTAPSHHHHHKLFRDPKVRWTEQLVVKKRVKRDHVNRKTRRQQRQQRMYEKKIAWGQLLNDNLWSKMWYLHEGAKGGYDMNVLNAWKRGYSGRGVVVTILDDGIEHSHPDLKPNYDPEASADINGQDKDPMPRYSSVDDNRHGTRCAGEVAAVANNSKCVVGVAYNAKIGGIRMLDGEVSDYTEAMALGHNPQHVDIYSASWGPDDTGQIVDGPDKLAQSTLINGVLRGRSGLGSIFVWASGNGGIDMDSCACDGYTNSVFTLSVSSVTEHNTKPWYLEECASTLATTYSSGENYHHKKMVSTDIHGSCTEEFTGTSASAPLAAGIVALALEANPKLTWRDMQHLVVQTANSEPFTDGEWTVNAVGRKVSLRYGYGLMDAFAMVQLAERWITVQDHHVCSTATRKVDLRLDVTSVQLDTVVDGCSKDKQAIINYLEHVQLKVSLKYYHRGDLEIFLTSPGGTRCKMLPKRKKDRFEGTFIDWPFTSVFFWGEKPQGQWVVEFINEGSALNHGIIDHFQLILYGTADDPVRVLDEPMRMPPGGFDFSRNDAPTSDSEPGSGESASGEVSRTTAPSTKLGAITSGPSDDLPQCDPMCDLVAGCSGPDLSDCLACKYVLLQETGLCASSCPNSTYIDDITNMCVQCVTPCASCTVTACTSCTPYSYLHNGLCLEHCPQTYYSDAATGTCLECTSPCLWCEGQTDHCVRCVEGYELDRHHGHKCVLVCADDQYKNAATGECADCHPTCGSCVGPEDYMCASCVTGLIYYNGSCVDQCPDGSVAEPRAEGLVCVSCHPSCVQCGGPTAVHCLQCPTSLILLSGTCVDSCPRGQFALDSAECLPCASNCSTCYDATPTSCLSCPHTQLLQESHCVSTCSDGFYPQDPGSCARCHRSCETCTGALLSDCLSCSDGLYLTGGQCRTECAANEFEAVEPGLCGPCHPSCQGCQGPLHSECVACWPEHFLLHRECVQTCPRGHYPSPKEGVCRQCPDSCVDCTGGNGTSCTECLTSLTLDNGQCRNVSISCDIHEYFVEEQQACLPCHPSCSECSGPGSLSCVSCAGSLVLHRSTARCLGCCPYFPVHLVNQDTDPECCLCHHTGQAECIYLTTNSSLTTLSPASGTPPPPLQDNNPPSSTLLWSTATPYTSPYSPRTPTIPMTTSAISPGTPVACGGERNCSRLHVVVSSPAPGQHVQLVSFLALGCVSSIVVFFLLFGYLQYRAGAGLSACPACHCHDYHQVPTAVPPVVFLHEAFQHEDEFCDNSGDELSDYRSGSFHLVQCDA